MNDFQILSEIFEINLMLSKGHAVFNELMGEAFAKNYYDINSSDPDERFKAQSFLYEYPKNALLLHVVLDYYSQAQGLVEKLHDTLEAERAKPELLAAHRASA